MLNIYSEIWTPFIDYSITFTFMYLADAFIQSDLPSSIQAIDIIFV